MLLEECLEDKKICLFVLYSLRVLIMTPEVIREHILNSDVILPCMKSVTLSVQCHRDFDVENLFTFKPWL